MAQVLEAVGSTEDDRILRLRIASTALVGVRAYPLTFVFGHTLIAEIAYLLDRGRLLPDVAGRLSAGFVAAAAACGRKGPGCCNSAGFTPRNALIEAKVTLDDLMALLTALALEPVVDDLCNAPFSFYGERAWRREEKENLRD